MILHKVLYSSLKSYNLFGKSWIFLQINVRVKKMCYFVCKLRKTIYLCAHRTKRENMNVTNLINLIALQVIRVMVVTSRGEKGYYIC